MILNVSDLHITLKNGTVIANHIHFSVERGKMFAIVGGSGAGKTTVCRSFINLLGEEYIVNGEAMFEGRNLFEIEGKERAGIYGKEICYIMQNPMTAFNPSIPIGKQLVKTVLNHETKAKKAEIMQKYADLLQGMGLEDISRIWKSYPFELSGGMLQRIMLAAAMIEQPKLLIADEATTAIDACNRMNLMNQLKRLCEQGMSVILVTHDLKVASKADSILIMNRGEMVEAGETKQILSHSKHPYTKELLDACEIGRFVHDRVG